MPSLSYPQHVFLNRLQTKYRAYVGGFGCVHPDTRVWTEHGLRRISDIDRPMRVLSWCEKNQRFQLSLSGGAFPKGVANLYRIATQQGEFVASGHHRVFCADGRYRQVSDLREGDELYSCDPIQLETIAESGLISLPSSGQHYSETIEDLMGGYADAARRYGQQLLSLGGHGQSISPSQSGALQFGLLPDLASLEVPGWLHNHQDQSTGLRTTKGYQNLFERLADGVAGCISSLFSGHTLGCRQAWQQFRKICEHHRKDWRYSPLYRSSGSSLSKSTATIKYITIESQSSEYWDMQVLDTNNYVTEDGCIHHNSGKTFIGCIDLLLFAGQHPKTVQGYFGPTYPSIRDIFFPTFEEAAHLLGFTVDIKEANKEAHIYRGRAYYGTVICRSMDKPGSIIGFKIARALVDEIDTLPKDKATAAWRKIVARLRLVIPGVENGIGVTTTPEGFMFVYDHFALEPTASYSMVQASTYENTAHLPPDYIDTLIETYPEELIQAYLKGQFVNLKSGTVYNAYDRTRCRSNEVIHESEPLRVGMDFNVTNMSAVTYVLRGKEWHAVDELKGIYDTPAMIATLKERYKGHNIRVYPDASGGSRKTVDASRSDISLLEQAGLPVYAHKANPAVKDRVMAANKAFQDGVLKVNDTACPEFARCLEQLAYDDNGEPDKKSNLDHLPDAGTYPIAYEMPIHRPALDIKVSFR